MINRIIHSKTPVHTQKLCATLVKWGEEQFARDLHNLAVFRANMELKELEKKR